MIANSLDSLQFEHQLGWKCQMPEQREQVGLETNA